VFKIEIEAVVKDAASDIYERLPDAHVVVIAIVDNEINLAHNLGDPRDDRMVVQLLRDYADQLEGEVNGGERTHAPKTGGS
jgi:hypothetical protein